MSVVINSEKEYLTFLKLINFSVNLDDNTKTKLYTIKKYIADKIQKSTPLSEIDDKILQIICTNKLYEDKYNKSAGGSANVKLFSDLSIKSRAQSKQNKSKKRRNKRKSNKRNTR